MDIMEAILSGLLPPANNERHRAPTWKPENAARGRWPHQDRRLLAEMRAASANTATGNAPLKR
jgi:hypothetical protein